MDFKKLKVSAIAIAVFLGLTIFYVNSKGANVNRHNEVVSKFHELKHVSALINQDLMSLRLVILPSFDTLTNNLAKSKNLLGQLGSGSASIYRQGDGETDHLYEEYERLIDEREHMIENFKGETAQLNNSLQYLPSAIEQLRNRANEQGVTKNLDSLLRDILIYNVAPSNSLKTTIQTNLSKIAKHPAMQTEEALSVMRHPKIILEKKEAVDSQLKKLIELPLNETNEQLFDVYNLNYTQSFRRSNRYRYLLYLACLGLLGYALYTFLRLRRTAVELHEANTMLEHRVRERTADLEKALDNLKRTQTQLLQSEKLSAVGQLAAGVAHEINNPLGIILGFAQAIVRKVPQGDPLESHLKAIEREAMRCKNLVQDLLTFSRTGKTERIPLDINSAIEEGLSLIKTQVKMKNIQINERLGPNLPHVLADKNKLQQVVINLSNNAIDAMPENGQLTISTELIEGTPQSWVLLKISDTGTGIPPEVLPRIFEPFFTTKPVGKGTGLGLSLVYETIKSHSGIIDVSSRPGLTEMMIKLPVRTGLEMEEQMIIEKNSPKVNPPAARGQAA